MASSFDRSLEAATYVRGKLEGKQPVAWLVLGSGLGDFANNAEDPIIIPYGDIPNFPKTTVAGHAGRLVAGTISGKFVVIQQGRWHMYEGHDPDTVVIGIRVMHHLGIKQLIVTNAAGGANLSYKPGDLMLMTDHINNLYMNPLVGPNDDRFGPRFPDMSAYSEECLNIVRKAAETCGVKIQEGVYLANRGPTYETPAEVRMARVLGADAVGMSTVPEVIAARHQGAKVIGISCITNMAAGILPQPLDHKEVQEVASMASAAFTKLVLEIVKNI
jgi:purine-nucleoside phosphorylase